MQMTLNEDESSSTNIQDFFSQFGKTDTSSHSETAGIAIQSMCLLVYICRDYMVTFPHRKVPILKHWRLSKHTLEHSHIYIYITT